MNLLLLEADEVGEVAGEARARVAGRRFEHLRDVLRAGEGDVVRVGVVGGAIGRGRIAAIGPAACELVCEFDAAPPPPAAVTLVLALPRPPTLRKSLAVATSMGVKRIVLLHSARVEKSYWHTPALADRALRDHLLLALEQARDTIVPDVTMARRFRPFVEEELPALAAGSLAVVGDGEALESCPRGVTGPVTLAVGPEGGFVDQELEALEAAGLRRVSLGPRPLRVEQAVAALLGRIL